MASSPEGSAPERAVPCVTVIVDGRLIGPHSTVEDINALCMHACSFPRAVRAALVDVLAASIETRGILPPSTASHFGVPAGDVEIVIERLFSEDEIVSFSVPHQGTPTSTDEMK